MESFLPPKRQVEYIQNSSQGSSLPETMATSVQKTPSSISHSTIAKKLWNANQKGTPKQIITQVSPLQSQLYSQPTNVLPQQMLETKIKQMDAESRIMTLISNAQTKLERASNTCNSLFAAINKDLDEAEDLIHAANQHAAGSIEPEKLMVSEGVAESLQAARAQENVLNWVYGLDTAHALHHLLDREQQYLDILDELRVKYPFQEIELPPHILNHINADANRLTRGVSKSKHYIPPNF